MWFCEFRISENIVLLQKKNGRKEKPNFLKLQYWWRLRDVKNDTYEITIQVVKYWRFNSSQEIVFAFLDIYQIVRNSRWILTRWNWCC